MTEIQHKTKKSLYDQKIPNLVELQINSYDWFLKEGLKELLDSFSPITNYDDTCSLYFIDNPKLEKPINTEEDCRKNMTSYEAPVKVKVQLVNNSDGKEEFLEEELFLAELPIMTDNGTFFINGAERVVVSQLSRSPGAYFEYNFDNNGDPRYTGKILPTTGAWIEMFTNDNKMMAHIAQSAKFPITVLLRALNKIDEACPTLIDSLVGTSVSNDIKQNITDLKGKPLFAPVKKSKKGSENSVFTKEEIDKLKEIYGEYIYSHNLGKSIRTTVDILNVFGHKEFLKISELFQINNYVKDPSSDKMVFVDNDVVVVPLEDKKSELNKLFRVLNVNIYKTHDNDNKLVTDKILLFEKGLKFDDKSLIVSLPLKDTIVVDDKVFTREFCINYLAEHRMTDEYKNMISGVQCEEANLLFEWLKVKKQNDKKRYNVENIRPVNDILNTETGEVLCHSGEIISKETAEYLYENNDSVYLEYYNVSELISNTIKNEDPDNREPGVPELAPVTDDTTAILALQRYMRPKEPSNEQAAVTLVRNFLFENKRYDVGKVGRYKLNRKLGLNLPEFAYIPNKSKTRSITRDDVVKLIKYTVYLSKDGKIISEFNDKYRDMILEKIDEYISKVRNGIIEGVYDIKLTEIVNQDDEQIGSILKTEVIKTKYKKIEDSILDGRFALYTRFKEIISEAEKGYLLTKEEYAKLSVFLKAVSDDLGEDLPYVKYAISDSPENLNTEYVTMRVNSCITDEIDHLENKRVRSVGELLQEQLRTGFLRMEKVCKERMNQNDKEKMNINSLISTKSISGSIRQFFGSSQLSQFMDQTNPLAELTHKRRLSALGPGGLSRQSAKLEVRDVHHSHYGRICPIETPEGPNIGLIGSMAIHARINEYGFLETPYRIVRDGLITEEIKYLSAEEESHEYIATANTPYDEKEKKILSQSLVVRHNGKYPKVECEKVTLMEISPNQIMSVAANLIPFIENDDANRALMGSNMQRQAVPLLKPTAPIVRTGIEGQAAHDSGVEKFAKRDGKIVWVSSENIVVQPEEPKWVDEYEISFIPKKRYDKRDSLFSCIKRRYAFDDKNKTKVIEEKPIAINSVISHIGVPSYYTLDDVKYLYIEPENDISSLTDTFERVITVPKQDNIEVGDLIFDRKVYKGKNKVYVSKNTDLDCINGIILNISNEINEETDEEQLKLTVKECDLYCLECKCVRNAFPNNYTVVKFGNAELKADSAGVGCGKNNQIEIIKTDDWTWKFDVLECDDVRLTNMVRSNQGTCINSRAIVDIGRRVYGGELLADGPCTDHGELALGQNVTVAFMPWNGYNYEDAILLNERLVKDDKFSSIHIEKYETEARDTKNGPEEITRDIPNVGEDSLKNLDERGIIKIGASVKAQDILVGKIAPKGIASEPSSEDRLIRSIFGNKAEETRDVSLKVPHGETGTVVDVKVFSRFKYECTNSDCKKTFEPCKKFDQDQMKCDRCGAPLRMLDSEIDQAGVNQLVRVYIAQKRKIMKGDKMAGRHGNKGVISNILQEADMPFKPDGKPVDLVLNPLGVPSRMNIGQILETHQGYAGKHLGLHFKNPIFQSATEKEIIADLEIMTTKKIIDALLKYIEELEISISYNVREFQKALNLAIKNVTNATGDDLLKVAEPLYKFKNDIYAKVLDEVKTYDAFDLEILSENLCCDPVINDDTENYYDNMLQIKDLNHNKYKCQNAIDSIFDDDSNIDNINELEDQISRIKSEYSYAVPQNYNYDRIIENIEKVIVKRVGFYSNLAKTDLYDGRTGEKMKQPVCVGTIYMLKLHHLVEDKMHARATGPYSLVTQQPLGGKAQFGGQRFGEMEVWALEAYGAAYTLQEILTIKSDDVIGRVDTYEAIVKGKAIPNSGIPESFKILVNELQSLCLKISVEDENGKTIDIRTYDDTELK